MTVEELEQLREMPTTRIRQNYHCCQEQINMCFAEQSPRLENACRKLQEWQSDYLDELVRRGARV